MSNSTILLLSAILGCVLVISNAYWYLRERAVRRGLQESAEWDRRDTLQTSQPPQDLEAAAETLDTSVDDIPRAVEALDEKVRQLQNSLETSRNAWATVARDALFESPPNRSGTTLIVHLINGSSDDAQTFMESLDREGVTAVCAHRDNTFVLVSESHHSAIDLARDTMAEIPGGAGGSEHFAQGGSQNDSVFKRLEETLDTVVDVGVRSITVGERGSDENG